MRMEERAGERSRVWRGGREAPLPGPLPARSSRGEGNTLRWARLWCRRQLQIPHVHAVRPILSDVWVFDQPMRERCLAHRPFAEPHDLGVDGATRRFGRRSGADGGEAKDVNCMVRIRRADSQSRSVRAEGDRDGHDVTFLGFEYLSARPRPPIPEPNRASRSRLSCGAGCPACRIADGPSARRVKNEALPCSPRAWFASSPQVGQPGHQQTVLSA